MDPSGRVLPDTRCRAATGSAASIHELSSVVSSVVREALGGRAVIGVGVAVPGPVDEATGVTSPINLPVLHGFPLRSLIAEVAGEEHVEFRRDGVALALGEHWLGAGRGVSALLAVTVSTGIGGGVLIGGRALGGNAGHIGQIEVSGLTGGDCLGRTTMLESVASGPHIVEWARAQGFSGTSGEELAIAYAAGDPLAASAVARCAEAVGQAIGSALALVPVDVVSVGGGFSRVADDLVSRIGEVVAAHPLPYVAATPVLPAGLGADAPLVGAAALVYRSSLLPRVGSS